MFGKPLVSVVIPCFNVEEYLEACLQSVFAQDYRPLDIILVDNNSTDKTLEIAKKIAKEHPLMVKVLQQSKQGAPAARNMGLQFAAGEWIQFLDADDLLLAGKINQQMSLVINGDDRVGVVAGAYKKNRLDGAAVLIYPEKEQWLGLFRSGLGITSSNLWKKEVLARAGGWKEEQQSSQEYELMFRMFQTGTSVIPSNEVLTIVSEREGSISQPENKIDFWHRWIELRTRIIDFLVLDQPEFFEQLDYRFSVELLKKLIYYYQVAPQQAIEIFRNYFPHQFRLKDSELGKGYRFLFNWFGFERGTSLYYKYLA